MKTRAQRLALPLGGALIATGLVGGALAAPAGAAAPKDRKSVTLAASGEAKAIATTWTSSKLKTAKSYLSDSSASGRLQKSATPAAADGKPGAIAPTGKSSSSSGRSKNVNLPTTVGKVFFEVNGKPYWCSASAVQSKYKNLIATAGHCVYRTELNKTVDNFVFIPGYHQGKAPFGIYVGAKMHTHYDFDVYEDYDKDYAFVNVYNGVKQTGVNEVNRAEYDAWKGVKYTEDKEIGEEAYKEGVDRYGPAGPYFAKSEKKSENVGPSYPGALASKVEVTELTYERAPKQSHDPDDKEPNGTRHSTETTALTEPEYERLLRDKAAGKVPGKVWKDSTGFHLTQYYLFQWIKETTNTTYYVSRFYVKVFADAGRLGDNVGGQGFAWNQRGGKKVFAFGYPTAAHLDGDKVYSGETMKWCYGTTVAAPTVRKYKAEEHRAIKCAFTPGASGGPFLMNYSSAKRQGYLNGVVSLTLDSDGNKRYDRVTTPYFDGETYAIYKHAANLWTPKLSSR
ncbi:hypothetical protein SAMN05421505_13115 [Sinosporangium album]|uniref:V8-like Glu-specific endopeptidase n=1 Tax=Sinosporangium album TaxID=504805 RepID=A0A1G8H889_9ACTN|nr:hypothetical protein [Sinosporangium album]SDI02894.1 hypothetical protein SAMN05421505_13115 [Sinosporangium album]